MNTNRKGKQGFLFQIVKSELGRKLAKAPPKSLAKLRQGTRELIASQLGYKKNRNS